MTVARSLSDTFAGIAPASVVTFVIAQVVGAGLAVAAVRVLYPVGGAVPGERSRGSVPGSVRPATTGQPSVTVTE